MHSFFPAQNKLSSSFHLHFSPATSFDDLFSVYLCDTIVLGCQRLRMEQQEECVQDCGTLCLLCRPLQRQRHLRQPSPPPFTLPGIRKLLEAIDHLGRLLPKRLHACLSSQMFVLLLLSEWGEWMRLRVSLPLSWNKVSNCM